MAKRPVPLHVKEAADAAMRRSGMIPAERRKLPPGSKPAKVKGKSKSKPKLTKDTVEEEATREETVTISSREMEEKFRSHLHKRWNERIPDMVQRWCAAGMTDAEIVSMLGIDLDVFYEWLGKYPELNKAYRAGDSTPDRMVERMVFAKAMGFTHRRRTGFTEDGVPVYKNHWIAPSMAAIEMWLYNRMPDKWKKRLEPGVNTTPSHLLMLDPVKLASMKPAQLEKLSRLLQTDEGYRLLSLGMSPSADQGPAVDLDVSEYARMVGDTA